jgi:hypothetical protein
MQVKAHCLWKISKPVTVPPGVLGYRDFVAEPDWKRNLISTTSVLYHPERRRVVYGLTAFDTGLMYEFDPDATRDQTLSANYSCRVGQGRVSFWWACASHARGGLHAVRWKQARPSDRRPTRVLACLSPPYIVMNHPG